MSTSQFSMSLLICSLIFLFVHSAISQQYEGDVCKRESNRKWTCKKIQDCETAFHKIRDEKPKICSFNDFTLIVCCEPSETTLTESTPPPPPPPTSTTSKPATTNGISKSEQKCEEYAKYVFDKPAQVSLGIGDDELENQCGLPVVPLIVDGDPTGPREFPHQVNIGYRYAGSIKFLCGGSLISENFVLSAAHCSKVGSYGTPKVAVIGDLDTSRDDDDAEPEERRIIQIINHPGYFYQSVYNDIALYKLDRNVKLNPYRRPACLNTKHTIRQQSAIATGWGDIARKGPHSTHLLKVNLNMISHKNCSQYWPSGKGIKNGIDDETMICAGDLRGRKDTCQGDSGGPLQVILQEPYCMYSLVGVTSFGKECGIKTPGIYTRVSNYVPWIESIVWP